MSESNDQNERDANASLADAGHHSDRDFDRPLENLAAPVSPEEAAAAAAIEGAAQAEAEQARERLLQELETLDPIAEATMAPFQPKHGSERWPVKTVTDPDRAKIGQQTEQTTIERLWLLKRPDDMPLKSRAKKYQATRAEGPETTIWQIEATIISHKWEDDGDYHVVVSSLTTGRTMIVESPQDGLDVNGEPFVDPSSPFKQQIEQARDKLRTRLNPKPGFHSASILARITGLGFFDIDHGQTGLAKTNAIELHPVIDIEVLD